MSTHSKFLHDRQEHCIVIRLHASPFCLRCVCLWGIRPTGQPLPPRAACAAPAGGSSRAPRHSRNFVSDRVKSTETQQSMRFHPDCTKSLSAGSCAGSSQFPAAPRRAPAASAPQRHAPSQAPAEPRRANRKAPEHRPIPGLQSSSPNGKRSKPVLLKEDITQLPGQLRPCNPEPHTATRWGAP